MTTTQYPPQPPPTLTSLVLIPPILDCIVTYLHTLDLLSWSSTSLTIRTHLLSSHAAWRAICFYTPTRYFEHRRRENVTSVFASTIAVRGQYVSPRTLSPIASDGTGGINGSGGGGGNGEGYILGKQQDPTTDEYGRKIVKHLSIDTTLTVLARLLPLQMYTSIDLSRTLADKYLLRDLVDNCSALRYLRIEECPKVRIADLVVGLYGVEKRVLRSLRVGGGAEGGVSLVAEVMGRTRVVVVGGGGGGEGKGGERGILSRLTHVHTKEVRDGLYRLNELRDGVRGEIVRAMSRMEDVYEYPDIPEPLEFERKGVVQLREIQTDLKLHRSTYNGPGWLERLTYSQGDYLWVLCHLLGVTLICADS
ncbi:hypothetical protein TWF730_006554 [Orbilia blumenaviensis]|uniref:F-box domain-containing protein n=1 Tax=Orbilia blumenaviensis TaxID=1796055 RepID=A0AAV9VI32_9PEZI